MHRTLSTSSHLFVLASTLSLEYMFRIALSTLTLNCPIRRPVADSSGTIHLFLSSITQAEPEGLTLLCSCVCY